MWRAIFLIIALILATSACSPGSNISERQVKGTIMRYNQLLTDGFKNMNMTPLQEVATPEQAQKEYYLMAALGEGKVWMESRLKDIRFLAVRFPSESDVLVTTREKWDYSHRDIATGKTVKEVKDVVYELSYQLKRTNRGWVVTSVGESASGKIK